MAEENDPAMGEEPLPLVQIEGQNRYPIGVEKIATFSCVIASILLISPALSADVPLPDLVQTILAVCGLPISGFVVARILTIVIHRAATS